ncbi:MAG TPA: hypothetical protein VHO67_00900 [Polyangia bacterium]|nr:hypothetical protein [Polyangia bacterium]
MSRLTRGIVTAAALAAVAGAGCRKGIDDQGQIGAAVGEVMASADDAANGPPAAAGLTPAAQKAACYPFAFSACNAGVRTETLDSCTFGPATVDGTVTLTFSDTTGCSLAATGASVNRTAEFTVTGPYGGTLTVTSPGGGQILTRTAGGFDFAVPGMERVLEGPRGNRLFDIATQTTTPLSITGVSRADFTIVAGTLVVSHRLAGYNVALTPEDLAWKPTCTCAVSGKLTGKVSGGHADGKSVTVTLTGCGTADVDVDGDLEPVTLDRCAAI